MPSPSRRGWLSPIISLTIRSEVIGDFHEPYGAIVTGGPTFFAKFWNAEKAIIFRKLESASGTDFSLCNGELSHRLKPVPQKSKGADLPQSRRHYPSVSVLTRRINE